MAVWVALCALAVMGACATEESGGGGVTEEDSRADTSGMSDTSGTSGSTSGGTDGEDDATPPECTQDSDCPTPPGLRTCEGDVAIISNPTALCDTALGICRVEGPPQRIDCGAFRQGCERGECIGGEPCPAQEAVIGASCDAASQEGKQCTYGEECCCGQCYPSLVCTCSGGQYACLSTDACLRPGCPGECSREVGCAEGEYCDFTDGLCGAVGFSDGKGQCKPLPYDCDAGGVGACACDGSTPLNDCEAAARGQDITRFGGCALEAGGFGCGDITCSAGEYCAIQMNDTPGPVFFASCVALPEACDQTAPACGCLDLGDFATCNDSTGQVVVVYPGG